MENKTTKYMPYKIQKQNYRPQQKQQPHVNQMTSEPVDTDSSSDDEYLHVLSQDTHGSKFQRCP